MQQATLVLCVVILREGMMWRKTERRRGIIFGGPAEVGASSMTYL